MKRNLYLLAGLLLVFALSCKKENAPQGNPEDNSKDVELSSDVSIRGIVAWSASSERGKDELTATMDNSKSEITLTTTALYTNQEPVDLTKVVIELTLAAGATSDVKDAYDLDGKTAEITITAQDGKTQAKWTVSAVRTEAMIVIPTSVTTTVEDVWVKTAVDLGVKSPLWGGRSIAAYREGGKDYLYILDNVLPYSEDNRIRIHDAKTGIYIDEVKEYEGGWNGARSYTWAIDTDDAGHIAMTRLNADMAGFWLDLYDNAAGGWAYLGSPLQYPQNQEGLTYYCGKKMQALGNLVSGQGKIIATCGHFYGRLSIQAAYDTFIFTDGVPASSILSATYPTEWWAGEIQQESMDDPTMYVTIVDEVTYGTDPEETWPDLHASHFEIYDPTEGSTVAVSDACFNYRILASKVFNVGSGKYLYTLEQKYSTISPYVERLYFISDEALLKEVTPDSEDYFKFLLWESEDDMEGDSNDYRFGTVSVLPDETGNAAVLFAYHPSSDSEKAKICARRVVFQESFE